MTYEAVAVCEHCRGNGAEPGTPITTCERCGGAGQLRQVSRTPFGQMARAVVCDVCNGAGKIPETPCEVCRGAGRTPAEVTKEIEVPAGIEDGQTLRVSGAGHAGEVGAPPGDLYVEVRVAADERFRRDGNDLISLVSVPATEAMLGTKVTVPTLEGERGDRARVGDPAGPRGDAARRRAAATRRSPARQPAGNRQRRRPDQPQRRAARAGRPARRDAGRGEPRAPERRRHLQPRAQGLRLDVRRPP